MTYDRIYYKKNKYLNKDSVQIVFDSVRLGLWCLMQLSTIFQLYRAVSFIGRGNQSNQRSAISH